MGDVKVLRRIVEQELSHAVFEPANWPLPVWKRDDMFTSPGVKWRVCRDDAISAVVGIPIPVNADDEHEPFVGIYVPGKWKRLSRFTTLLVNNEPRGFDDITNHPDEGFMIDYPIWKYVPYGDFVRGSAGFDLPAFLRALTNAAKSIVAMEKRIDQLLASLR